MRQEDLESKGVSAATVIFCIFFLSILILIAAFTAKANPNPVLEVEDTKEEVTKDREKQISEVEVYIKRFLGKMRDKRWKRVSILARLIVDSANKYGLDYMLVTVVVRRESSFWEGAVGSIGEYGLMQIHPKNYKARKGHDLRTSRGQLEAGCALLAKCIKYCYKPKLNEKQNLLRALTLYQSGTCNSKIPGPLGRLKLYYKAKTL